MNSSIKVILNNAEEFDGAVHGSGELLSLADSGNLRLITKDKGTRDGNPIACLTFTVMQQDGSLARAQTVLTVRTLQMALATLRGRYGDV